MPLLTATSLLEDSFTAKTLLNACIKNRLSNEAISDILQADLNVKRK